MACVRVDLDTARQEIDRLRAALTARDKAIEAQADKLRALQPNWDSYGALVISEKAITAAVATALATPQLTPCSNGGVQLDWSNAEITFTADGEQEFDVSSPKVRKAIEVAEEALRLTVCECRCSITHLYGFGPENRDDGFKCQQHSCKVCAALAALAAVKEQG